MKTLFEENGRRQLRERLGRLAPAGRPQWGKMNAPQMVAHCADSLRMALGTLPARPKRLPIRYPPLKQLIVYWLPFPKGAPTAPELLARSPAEWTKETSDLAELVEAVGSRGATASWPDHPAFGRLSRRAWGVLTYRHLDHHFRQFGV